jgi:hypothetical protein
VDPEMNEPRGARTTRTTRTTRRLVLTKPHRTHRDRAEQAVVWRRRRASWGTSAVIFFVLAVAGAVGGWGTTLVALDLAAGVMSAAVVVKAQVMVRRAEEVPPVM